MNLRDHARLLVLLCAMPLASSLQSRASTAGTAGGARVIAASAANRGGPVAAAPRAVLPAVDRAGASTPRAALPAVDRAGASTPRAALPAVDRAGTSTPRASPAANSPSGASRPLTMTISEARGAGRPLWRRWVDLDGDGKKDLVVVAGSASAGETGAGSDQIEALVAYLRVTPDFLDRRELLVFRQTSAGLEPWGEPLPLTGDTVAVDLADIDGDGTPEILFASGYRIYAYGRKAGTMGYSTERAVLFDAPLLIGNTRSFLPRARLAAELAIGRPADLLLATPAGLEIHLRGQGGGFDAKPSAVVRNPLRTISFTPGGTFLPGSLQITEPIPRVVDVDNDGTLDILFVEGNRAAILDGRGAGEFASRPRLARVFTDGSGPASGAVEPGATRTEVRAATDAPATGAGGAEGGMEVKIPEDAGATDEQESGDDEVSGDSSSDVETEAFPPDQPPGGSDRAAGRSSSRRAGPLLEVGHLVDIDGDGLLDHVRRVDLEFGDGSQDGTSKRDKKGPIAREEIRYGRPGFLLPGKADRTISLERREKFEGAETDLRRIDADGRLDLLVTRFSVGWFQIARVLMTKKISVGVSFESRLQRADGSFAPPAGRPFETKVLIDLKRGISASPTDVRGDYNGDGITDLIEFTDRPAVQIHLTTPRGEFPEKPALAVPLPRMPGDAALTDIEDLDGDGRSDIAFFTPEGAGFVITLARSAR